MGKYTQDDVCVKLTLPVDPTVGLTLKLDANQKLEIRVEPRNNAESRHLPLTDINGVEIKVGDTVLDWLTQGSMSPSTIESLEHLDRLYVHSWGLLEVIK